MQRADGIRVRPCVADDRPFVVAGAERLQAFGPPPWRTAREIVDGELRTLDAFFDRTPDGTALFVAESDAGGKMGFMYVEEVRDYFTLERHGHIGILVVAAHAEGLGAGASLMRTAETWARDRGYRTLTLNVFDGNHRARRVYEHLGYAPDTIRYVKRL
jgi:GNAT superfamily N-acetyltransferase